MSERFRAYRVERSGEGTSAAVRDLEVADLPPGDLLVRVAYSSLNYKDALSARGRPGVTREYPHTPGIDAAGTVVSSASAAFTPGDPVIVTSYDLGMDTPGGYGELVRVPAEWALPLPPGLSLREAMILGTAGLTAGMALEALERHGLQPDRGPLFVSGASGGVGSFAVALLAGRGFEVVAGSGKRDAHAWLKELGATTTVGREELGEPSSRPLLKGAYAGGVDTVGGPTLANLLKSTRYGGVVAACGLVQSPELHINVYPFILRGVSLVGIESAQAPMELRREVWQRLAGDWRPRDLEAFVTAEVDLDGLDGQIERILSGEARGRVLVRVAGEA